MKFVSIYVLMFCTSLLSLADENKNSEHSWGSVERIDGDKLMTKLRLRFNPMNNELEGQVSEAKHVLYFALQPNQQLQVSVEKYETTNLPANLLENSSIIIADNDTSIIRTVRQYETKQSLRNSFSTSPHIVISKYENYRGYYLARIEISPYIIDAQQNTLQYISDINLHFNVSSSLVQPLRTAQVRNKNDKHFESLLRDMIINYDDAVPYENNVLPFTATSWFNASAQYLKMAVAQDGLYRFTYQQLQTAFSALLNADPRTIQLFTNGTEIPLYVKGESDGVFNTTDYLEFPALKNYTGKHRTITTGTQEYNEYLNRYTDSTMYWLTFGVTNGLRMSSNPVVAQTAETLRAYTDFRHLESNSFVQFAGGDIVMQQNPLWTSHDMWGWGFVAANGNLSQPFSVSDVATNGDSARAYAKFVSWGANVDVNAHSVSVRINSGNDLGVTTIHRYGEAVVSGAEPVSVLVNGNNTVGVYSKPTSATTVNWIIPDWLEVEYPRQLKAINDSLLFDFRNLTLRTVRSVQISNFSSQDIAIYKIKPVIEKINNISFSVSAPYTVTFADTVGPQEQYIAITNARLLTPVIKKVKQFANISADKHQTDYLVVTHGKFISEAEQYRQYVAATKRMTTRLIDVEDIFDEFGYGYPTAEAMRDYFKSTTTWNSPIPSFLFLLGDASYDYKFVYGNTKAQNYVPSFGYPVSDPMLVTYDSLSNIPQMYVGRLPVNTVGEVTQYLHRVQTYTTTQNSEWNKRYLFFTGGDPNTSGQIESFKTVNNYVFNNYVRPAPIGGEGIHFYKTTNPQSDFGPYTSQQIKDAIAAGGVFISYIGHSGTQTWDNSIGDPIQLQNTQGKFPLITDFGCSTGKFAEPQITSFSESFIIGSTSSVIGYIGNSALGFTSIAAQLPIEFYKKILHDSVLTIGKAHLQGKVAMALNNFSAVNSVMLYTNTLVGDPSIDLAVPFKPNLSVTPTNIRTQNIISEEMDSVAVTVAVMNFGSTISDSVDIYFQHRFNGQVIKNVILRRPIPLFSDSVKFFITVKKKSGEHSVQITLDSLNKISEISKLDNAAQKSIIVISTNFRVLQPIDRNSAAVSKIILLNPIVITNDTTRSVILEIDTTVSLNSPTRIFSRMGNLTTEFDISTLPLFPKGWIPTKRYWWKAKINTPSAMWTTGTFYQGGSSGNDIGQNDSLAWSENIFTATTMEVQSSALINAKIQSTQIVLRAISSGFLDGTFGVVELNGFNVLNNSFSRGHSIVVIDTANYSVLSKRTFDLYNQAANADSIVAFINQIQNGMFVVVVVIDEGSNNFSSSARNAYSLIGAKEASKLGWRDSWAVIGKKGAPAGTALEMYKSSTTGKAIVETTFTKIETSGTIVTPEIGPVAAWNTLTIQQALPNGSQSNVAVLGVKQNGGIDTLLSSTSSTINLQSVSAITYPKLKLKFSLQANPANQSPVLSSWNLGVTSPAELTTSPQFFSLSKKIIQEGELLNINFSIHNVGISRADSFSILLFTNDSGSNRVLQTYPVTSLNAGDSIQFQYQYNSKGRRGNNAFIVSIDPDSKVTELYKSNNILSIPYTVLPDTVKPLLDLTFNGVRVMDGDYVSATPEVSIKFYDNNTSSLTLNDTSNFKIQLNTKQVYFNDPSLIQFIPGSSTVRAEIKWKPTLPDGENVIRYFARDVSGNYSDTTSLLVNVSTDMQLKDVYNIPNPFANNTSFTFTLTVVPEEFRIKIFTVAGRVIQEFNIPPSSLNPGFNRIDWSGRDKDGDEIANGIYFYRIIVKNGDKQLYTTEKLVKMR